MNELEIIKSQLTDINNKRIRYQTLIDQAKKQCAEIEQKYNISNEQQLQKLLEQEEQKYQYQLQEAQKYIEEANNLLKLYESTLC